VEREAVFQPQNDAQMIASLITRVISRRILAKEKLDPDCVARDVADALAKTVTPALPKECLPYLLMYERLNALAKNELKSRKVKSA
jgi:hypothetical protein